MALIVEDGTRKADADSLTTVEFADAYVAGLYGGSHAWAGYDTTEKERRLRVGTRYVCDKFEHRFLGLRVDQVQALSWPRWGACTDEGFELGYRDVPVDVQRAVVEAALVGDLAEMQPADTDQGVKRKKRKVGPLETETEYAGSSSAQPAYARVETTMRRLLQPMKAGRS